MQLTCFGLLAFDGTKIKLLTLSSRSRYGSLFGRWAVISQRTNFQQLAGSKLSLSSCWMGGEKDSEREGKREREIQTQSERERSIRCPEGAGLKVPGHSVAFGDNGIM